MGVYYAQYGTAWTLRGYKLVDRATGQYRSTPTLASGDFKIEKDGGAATNLATLPSVEPAAGTSIKLEFSASEMQCRQAVITMIDQAGAEWNDDAIHIFTVGTPNAYFQFDLFTATVALSSASLSGVTSAVWEEQRTNHTNPGTFGEGVASVQGSVTGDVEGDVQGDLFGDVQGEVTAIGAGGIDATSFAADSITASALSQGAAQEVADEVLNRNVAGGGSGATRNVRNALRSIRNRVRNNGGTLEVYEEDDTTIAWTAALTTAAGNPITEVDP